MIDSTIEFLYLLIIFLIFLWTYIGVKNELVYKARQKTLAYISQRAREAIDNNDIEWKRFYKLMDKPSYNILLWNPVAWTYKQMYPNIKDQLK